MSLPPPLPSKPPVIVIVIAILWALFSLLMLFTAIAGLLVWYGFDFPKHMPPPIPPQAPPAFAQLFGLLAYFDKMCILQIVLGLSMLITSLGFYFRMNWARVSMLFFSWLGIIYTVAFITFWITAWNSMTGMAPPTPEFNVSLFRAFGIAAGLFNAVFFIAPPAFLVWYLTQPAMRHVFTRNAENR